MPSICYSSIKGLAMRATRLDSTGKWVTGTTASAVSKGFVNINLSANIEEGSEFTVKNANGDLCVNEKDASRLKFFDLEIEFCEVDPELFELMTGARLLDDYAGNSVGYAMNETLAAAPHALEVWTKVAGAEGDNQYIYWLLPQIVNGIAGDYTIENGPASFTIKANTKSNSLWGTGPYNVVAQDAQLTAGVLLDPVLEGDHLYHRLTEIAPPTVQCGYVAQLVGWTAYTP